MFTPIRVKTKATLTEYQMHLFLVRYLNQYNYSKACGRTPPYTGYHKSLKNFVIISFFISVGGL